MNVDHRGKLQKIRRRKHKELELAKDNTGYTMDLEDYMTEFDTESRSKI